MLHKWLTDCYDKAPSELLAQLKKYGKYSLQSIQEDGHKRWV